jgi:hypothetical protein
MVCNNRGTEGYRPQRKARRTCSKTFVLSQPHEAKAAAQLTVCVAISCGKVTPPSSTQTIISDEEEGRCNRGTSNPHSSRTTHSNSSPDAKHGFPNVTHSPDVPYSKSASMRIA